METYSALLVFCARNSPVTGEFPAQRPVTQSFDVFFDLRLYKRLSKQSWGQWLETSSRPLWRHSNDAANHMRRAVVLSAELRWQVNFTYLDNRVDVSSCYTFRNGIKWLRNKCVVYLIEYSSIWLSVTSKEMYNCSRFMKFHQDHYTPK